MVIIWERNVPAFWRSAASARASFSGRLASSVGLGIAGASSEGGGGIASFDASPSVWLTVWAALVPFTVAGGAFLSVGWTGGVKGLLPVLLISFCIGLFSVIFVKWVCLYVSCNHST